VGRLAPALPLVVAVAACGGSNPAAAPSPTPLPPTTTLAPATLADLSAAVTSPDQNHQLNCRDDVHARVTLTNRAASGIVATGVRKSSNSLSGGCVSADDFTYRILPQLVAPNSTSVVMDRVLYDGGSGCCTNPKQCGGTCDIEEVFTVVTEIGSVPAGQFVYTLEFSGCDACGASATSRRSCRSFSQAAAAASMSSR